MDIPSSSRELPADLAIVLVLTLLAIGAAMAPVVRSSPIRLVFGFILLFFIPGYVLTAVLFPRSAESVNPGAEGFLGPVDRDFTRLERATLSVGLSIAVVALLALAIDASPFSLSLTPLLLVLGGFTALGTVIAIQRRLQLPPENRFRLDLRSGWQRSRAGLNGIRSDKIVNTFLILSILLASASIAYAATTPRDNEKYTRFSLLSENTEGKLVADNYSNDAGTGGMGEVAVGIENHEHERVNYSVLVILQSIEIRDDSVAVISSRKIARYNIFLSHNGAEQNKVDIPPIGRDEKYRLQFLLYRGGIPDDPSTDNAYRHTHLLINGSGDNSSVGGAANE